MVPGSCPGASTKPTLQLDAGKEGGEQCSGGLAQGSLSSPSAEPCFGTLLVENMRPTFPRSLGTSSDNPSTWLPCRLSHPIELLWGYVWSLPSRAQLYPKGQPFFPAPY